MQHKKGRGAGVVVLEVASAAARAVEEASVEKMAAEGTIRVEVSEEVEYFKFQK